jgi:multidrug efflux pump subunit AcrA (membrane-fusion protein)
MALKGLAELLKKIRGDENLTEAQAEEELNKILPTDWIPKAKFNETSEQAKLFKQQLDDTNTQLETLKSKAGLSDDYKKQIDDLTAKQKLQETEYKNQLTQLKRDTAIESALTGAKARNLKAARALLDESKIVLGDDGKVAGVAEQLEAIRKDNSYLFEATVDEGNQGGGQDQNSGKLPSFGGAGGSNQPPADSLTDAMMTAAGLK